MRVRKVYLTHVLKLYLKLKRKKKRKKTKKALNRKRGPNRTFMCASMRKLPYNVFFFFFSFPSCQIEIYMCLHMHANFVLYRCSSHTHTHNRKKNYYEIKCKKEKMVATVLWTKYSCHTMPHGTDKNTQYYNMFAIC